MKMATVFLNAKGQYVVQFTGHLAKRETIYLGKVPKEFADEFSFRVEQILKANEYCTPPPPSAVQWMTGLSARFKKKLAEKGLRDEVTVNTIAQLCQFCIDRASVEDSTLQKYHDTKANLVAHFGEGRQIHRVTAGDADGFKDWLSKHGRRPNPGPLADTTVSKRIEQARAYFAIAVRHQWILTNPFEGVKCSYGHSKEREHYVSRELVETLMDKADPDLKLIIGLARYLGLRIPSELWFLEWNWIDWESGSITVLDWKNRRFPHKKWRHPPLFPEIRVLLEEAWERTPDAQDDPERAKYITPIRRHKQSATALRNRLERLCRKCRIHAWDKLWQNLRSTRETELVDEGYPIHVVCAWLGNSPTVAIRNYLQVTKEHHRRAIGGGCYDLQTLTKLAANGAAITSATSQKS
jgi:integrase